MKNELICHQRFDEIDAELHAVLQSSRNGDPQILPVVGPTRVGKTTLLLSLTEGRPIHAGSAVREIVLVTCPKHWTGRALVDACLKAQGLSPELFRNHVTATDAMIGAFRKLGTRLIVFDETQHLLERGSSTSARAAGDFLKDLFDRTQASLVLLGLPALLGVFRANEQLAARARRALEFYPYQWHGKEYSAFHSAVAGALEMLVDEGWDAVDYRNADFVRRLYVATAGRYGMVHRLVQDIRLHANGSSAQLEDFAKAYERAVMLAAVPFNPFDTAVEIQPEHMTKVYTEVMHAAGVLGQGGAHARIPA
ncbi:TPA: TniB family NTP-binding protein [Pseudomonas aeruginosa]|nr:TniB family NTP-binding protein [Pseudomonas aeruginosa]HCJ6265380.1 TniB family NTP-binding protein [Pseudomonas aeruginosa]